MPQSSPGVVSVQPFVALGACHGLAISEAASSKKAEAVVHALVAAFPRLGSLIAHFAFRSGVHCRTSYYPIARKSGNDNMASEIFFELLDDAQGSQ